MNISHFYLCQKKGHFSKRELLKALQKAKLFLKVSLKGGDCSWRGGKGKETAFTHFTVAYIMIWPLTRSENGVDFVLFQ